MAKSKSSKDKIPQAVVNVNRILSSFFKITNPLQDQHNGTWTLRKSGLSEQTSDAKGTYTLIPFLISKNYAFYFSFYIKLLNNDEVDDVNLKIFKEDKIKVRDSGEIPTEKLLRVEWSNKKNENVKKIHAQPHWHIHSYKSIDLINHLPIDSQKSILELIEGENSQNSNSIMEENVNVVIDTPTIQTKEIPIFRFHLAMLAEWDKPATLKNDKILTDEVLKNWLPKCLNYIKEQLEYILEKVGE